MAVIIVIRTRGNSGVVGANVNTTTQTTQEVKMILINQWVALASAGMNGSDGSGHSSGRIINIERYNNPKSCLNPPRFFAKDCDNCGFNPKCDFERKGNYGKKGKSRSDVGLS